MTIINQNQKIIQITKNKNKQDNVSGKNSKQSENKGVRNF